MYVSADKGGGRLHSVWRLGLLGVFDSSVAWKRVSCKERRRGKKQADKRVERQSFTITIRFSNHIYAFPQGQLLWILRQQYQVSKNTQNAINIAIIVATHATQQGTSKAPECQG